MPRPTKGPRLGGSAQHQRHMLANLATQLFAYESIVTTETRAKVLRPYAEKLITKAKRGDLHARRTVARKITDAQVLKNLFDNLAPQFEGRNGGYTRIVKLPNRKGDNAPMAVIELVMEPVATKGAVAEATKVAEKAADAPKAEKAEAKPAAEESGKSADLPTGAHPPLESGEAPKGFEVKGNADSMKYHVPGSRWYANTIAEIWFDSAESAEAAGYAPAGGAAAQKVSAE